MSRSETIFLLGLFLLQISAIPVKESVGPNHRTGRLSPTNLDLNAKDNNDINVPKTGSLPSSEEPLLDAAGHAELAETLADLDRLEPVVDEVAILVPSNQGVGSGASDSKSDSGESLTTDEQDSHPILSTSSAATIVPVHSETSDTENYHNYEKTTFNPLDNMQDFATLQHTQNGVPESEFPEDQLAVESSSNLEHRDVAPTVISTHIYPESAMLEELTTSNSDGLPDGINLTADNVREHEADDINGHAEEYVTGHISDDVIVHTEKSILDYHNDDFEDHTAPDVIDHTIPDVIDHTVIDVVDHAEEDVSDQIVHDGFLVTVTSTVSRAVTTVIASSTTETISPAHLADIHNLEENPRTLEDDPPLNVKNEADESFLTDVPQDTSSQSFLTDVPQDTSSQSFLTDVSQDTSSQSLSPDFAHTPGTLSIVEVHPSSSTEFAVVDVTEEFDVPEDPFDNFLLKKKEPRPLKSSIEYDHDFTLSPDYPTAGGESPRGEYYDFTVDSTQTQTSLNPNLYEVSEVSDHLKPEQDAHHDQTGFYHHSHEHTDHHGYEHNVYHSHEHEHLYNYADEEDVNVKEDYESNESFVQHLADLGMHKEIIESAQSGGLKPDRDHPLVQLTHIEPHAMRIMIKPRVFQPKIMIRLLYERVPRLKTAHMEHLDDPVIEYIPLYGDSQEYGIENLPMGKYIVCAEAQIDGTIIQSNCLETHVERLDNNMLQSGVIAVIAVAIFIVFSVILYAVYYRIHNIRKKKKEKACPSPVPCNHCKLPGVHH